MDFLCECNVSVSWSVNNFGCELQGRWVSKQSWMILEEDVNASNVVNYLGVQGIADLKFDEESINGSKLHHHQPCGFRYLSVDLNVGKKFVVDFFLLS